MIELFLYGAFAGFSIGAVTGFAYCNFWRIKEESDTQKENEELQTEVKRLRAQVALHIGKSDTVNFLPLSAPGLCKERLAVP